jgi:hypothetical protein
VALPLVPILTGPGGQCPSIPLGQAGTCIVAVLRSVRLILPSGAFAVADPRVRCWSDRRPRSRRQNRLVGMLHDGHLREGDPLPGFRSDVTAVCSEERRSIRSSTG